MKITNTCLFGLTLLVLGACGGGEAILTAQAEENAEDKTTEVEESAPTKVVEDPAELKELKPDDPKAKVKISDSVWKKILKDDQFYILRKEGTERAFTGEYWDNKKDGMYRCAACGLNLYDSKTKFRSGTGWPSFYEEAGKGHVTRHEDRKLGALRIEVECARCGGHLGHVFPDGPKPTGLRHCINSAALKFEPREKSDDKDEEKSE